MIKAVWLCMAISLGQSPLAVGAEAGPPLQPVEKSKTSNNIQSTPDSGPGVAPESEQVDRSLPGGSLPEATDSTTQLVDDTLEQSDPAATETIVDSAPLVIEPVPAPPGGQFIVMPGINWLVPAFSTNPAFAVGTSAAGFSQRNFDYDLDATPEVWLGFVNDSGIGVRAHFFEYDDSSSVITLYGDDPNVTGKTVFVPAPLGVSIFGATGRNFTDRDSVSADSHLNVLIWDCEILQTWQQQYWSFLRSAGIRYAKIQQSFRVASGRRDDPAVAKDPSLVDFLTSNQNNWNVGPTVSFEAKRNVGAWFAFYGKSRGSILFGRNSQDVDLQNFTTTALPPVGLPPRIPYIVNQVGQTQVSDSRNTVVPVLELELGAQIGHAFGRCNFFVQAGFLGQIWWNGGNASSSSSQFDGGFSPDHNNNFGLYGLALRGGLGF